MITAVTAFIDIPNHPRSAQEYHKFGQRLLNIDIPLLFCTDGELHRCWLWHYLLSKSKGFTWSEADNPKKNSLAYHCVQAQKTELLVAASIIDPTADVFVWIDYGVFHVPGVTEEIIQNFLVRASNERVISIPGCWGEDEFIYDDNQPCWRFCGGVMVVPRAYVEKLNDAMKHEYIRWLNLTGNISWEVNTLARVERLVPDLPIWWYRADHNASMFQNYRATEDADGKQASTGLRGLEARLG